MPETRKLEPAAARFHQPEVRLHLAADDEVPCEGRELSGGHEVDVEGPVVGDVEARRGSARRLHLWRDPREWVRAVVKLRDDPGLSRRVERNERPCGCAWIDREDGITSDAPEAGGCDRELVRAPRTRIRPEAIDVSLRVDREDLAA